MLIHGQVVIDCLMEFNELIKNNQSIEFFKKRKKVFTEHYQLSNNEEYLKELNKKVLAWYDYCKQKLEEYGGDKVYSLGSKERKEIRSKIIKDIGELTSSGHEFINRELINDVKLIENICITNSLVFPSIVEKYDDSGKLGRDYDILSKIIFPTMKWCRLNKERYEREVDGENESDYEYFRFLRSICAVHPIGTDGHNNYLKAGSACAFTDRSLLDPSMVVADFYAVIYRENRDTTIPIKVKQIIDYLYGSFEYLSTEAVKGLKRLSEQELAHFKKTPIPLPGNDYMLYLRQLRTAAKTRYGHKAHIIDHWIRIFNTHFADPDMEKLLGGYKNWLKEKIASSHEAIQNMNWSMESWNCSMYGCDIPFVDGYSLEKIGALHVSEELIEDIWTHKDEEFLEEGYKAKTVNDLHRMWVMDRDPNADKKEYITLYEKMDDREFARYQLSKMHSLFKSQTEVVFCYEYGDWHLYIQYMVASWIYKKKNALLPNDEVS